jgi:hypothetical protein
MTLVSCVYLEDVGEKVYFPLHQNKKMRLNNAALEGLVNGMSLKNTITISEKLINLISSMVHQDSDMRPSIHQIQD